MSEYEAKQVTVVDIKMPFWSMVTFMVKWSIAAIPAIIILVIFGVGFAGFVAGFFSTFPH
jgi:CHASE2 domain-containing sensor protein